MVGILITAELAKGAYGAEISTQISTFVGSSVKLLWPRPGLTVGPRTRPTNFTNKGLPLECYLKIVIHSNTVLNYYFSFQMLHRWHVVTEICLNTLVLLQTNNDSHLQLDSQDNYEICDR